MCNRLPPPRPRSYAAYIIIGTVKYNIVWVPTFIPAAYKNIIALKQKNNANNMKRPMKIKLFWLRNDIEFEGPMNTYILGRLIVLKCNMKLNYNRRYYLKY